MESKNKTLNNLWKRLNPDELLYDIFILVGILFLHNLIVPEGKTIIDVLNPTTAMLLITSLYFFISFYFVLLLQRLQKDTKHHPIFFILVFINFALILGAFVAVPYIYLVDKGLFDEDSAFAPMFLGFVLMMPLSGILADSKFLKRVSGPFVAKSGLTFLYFLIRILLPVIVALMVGFWQEIMIVCSFQEPSDKLIVPPFVFNLIFGGVIPMRILMAILPPYRLINIIPGIITLGILLFEIFSKLHGSG